MDKLAAMETLVAIADLGSFTKAADLLDLPKTRVSQRINDLEQSLGVRLINRTTRTIKFTEDGMVYLGKCRAILQEIHNAESTLKESSTEVGGLLHVDALISVARHVLAPRLFEFQQRHPHIKLRLTASDRVSHLLEDNVDCAIRGGVLHDSSAVVRKLVDIHIGLYASPKYLKNQASITHPIALNQHRLISSFGQISHSLSWQLHTGDERFEMIGQASIIFDDPDIALKACIAGVGICPAVPFAAIDLVRQGILIPILPQWSFFPRPISAVYPSKRHMPARVRAFITWITEVMEHDTILNMYPIDLTKL